MMKGEKNRERIIRVRGIQIKLYREGGKKREKIMKVEGVQIEW